MGHLRRNYLRSIQKEEEELFLLICLTIDTFYFRTRLQFYLTLVEIFIIRRIAR